MDKPNINRSTRLPRQQKGGPVLLANRDVANLILSVTEQLLNLKVIQPTTDGQNILMAIEAQITRGELGMTITLPPGFNAQSGNIIGSGGGINFRGEYDPAATYNFNDLSLITYGTNKGTYLYISKNPSSGNAPYAGNGFWLQFPLGGLGNWM